MFLCEKEDLENISFHQLNLLTESGINYTSKDVPRKKQKNGLSTYTPEERSKMFLVLMKTIMKSTRNMFGYSNVEVYVELQASKFGKRSSTWGSYIQNGFLNVFGHMGFTTKVKQVNTYTMKNRLGIPIHINNRDANKKESVIWYTQNMPWGRATPDVQPENLTHDQIEASLYVYIHLLKKKKQNKKQ